MPRLARRLARRYLPHRVRAAGLALAGRERAGAPQAAGPKGPGAKAGKGGPKKAASQDPSTEPLVRSLRRGTDLAGAVGAQVRSMVEANDADGALALALTLEDDPTTADVGHLAAGIVAGLRGYQALAWRELSTIPIELAARLAPEELVRAGLGEAPAEAASRLDALAADSSVELPATSWLAMIGPVFGAGHGELARRLFDRFDALVGDGSDVAKQLVVHRDWLRRWVAARPGRTLGTAGPRGPGVVRDHGLRPPEPDPGVGQHRRPRPEPRLPRAPGPPPEAALPRPAGPGRPGDPAARPGPPRAAAHTTSTPTSQLIQIDRDASAYAEIPPNTWTLAFGWFMHAHLRHELRLPVPPQPAADLRVLPLQQARPADRRGDRLPPPVRARSAAATGRPSTSCCRSGSRRSSPAA